MEYGWVTAFSLRPGYFASGQKQTSHVSPGDIRGAHLSYKGAAQSSLDTRLPAAKAVTVLTPHGYGS